MIHRVFSRKVRRSHVVITERDEQLHKRIFRERAFQGYAGVNKGIVGTPVPRRCEASAQM